MTDPIVLLGWALALPIVAFLLWVASVAARWHWLNLVVGLRRRQAHRALTKASANHPERIGDIDAFVEGVGRSLDVSERWIAAKDRLTEFEKRWGIR